MSPSGAEVTLLLLLLGCLPLNPAAGQSLGCRDQDGSLVDWYVLNKLPKLSDTGSEFVDKGAGYVHFSSESTGGDWILSEVSIDDPLSASGRTLAPIYSNPTRDSLIFAFFNDVPPHGQVSGEKGHTKGVVAFDGSEGFWLVHSVPNFPPKPDKSYSYPNSGLDNGQSFLCITLNSNQIENVASLLEHSCPHFYDTKMSHPLRAKYRKMSEVINGQCNTEYSKIHEPLPAEFIAFAKTKEFGEDLYHDLVATELETDLFAETWRNGPGEPLPSNCFGSYRVQNVQNITVMAVVGTRDHTFEFPSTEDNSKWAVSDPKRYPDEQWVCIGDIDRRMPQLSRGGGTVCCRNDKLWKLYFDMVKDWESCIPLV